VKYNDTFYKMVILLIILLIWAIGLSIYLCCSKTNEIGGGSEINFDVPVPNFKPHYSRTITNLEKEKYGKRPDWTKISLHLGQRKLLCNEVEFLTRYSDGKDVVVYAGAAPGHHTPLLAQMFPNCKFHLYDPRAFNKQLADEPNVELHREYFTDEIAAKHAGDKALFMCDIRTGTVETADEDVVINMEQQRKWTELIKPKYAMLKFRLPWKPGDTRYFDGEIYLQPWVGSTSTETRLITTGREYTTYSNSDYEQQIFNYQRSRRAAYHDHDIKMPGIDHCHDCWSEIQIIKDYLVNSKKFIDVELPPDNRTIIKYISLFTKQSQWNLSQPPHGLYPNERDTWKKMKMLASTSENARYAENARKSAFKTAVEVTELKDKDMRTVSYLTINAHKLYNHYVHELMDKSFKLESAPNVNDIPKCESTNLMSTTLPADYPELEERAMLEEEKIIQTHGYRKTALIFAEFINKYHQHAREIVIIGAAPGVEFVFLAKLFPKHRFIIYDNRKMHKSLNKFSNIIIKQRFFTDREATNIKNSTQLLICNMYNWDKEKGHNWSTRRSHEMIKKWCSTIDSLKRALLLFRLPYDDAPIEFYSGDVMVAPWSKQRSQPLFISTDCKKMQTYQPHKLLRQLFKFNVCDRWGWYPHDVNLPNYDHCYDCWREIGILKDYLYNYGGKKTHNTDDIKKLMQMLNKSTYVDLLIKPHGMLKDIKDRRLKMATLAPYTIQYNNAVAQSIEMYNNLIHDIQFAGVWVHSEWEQANEKDSVDIAYYDGSYNKSNNNIEYTDIIPLNGIFGDFEYEGE